MPVSGSVLLLYAGSHKISLKYLFPEKMFIMPVPTKYHWNISFQKKCSSTYVVKNARNVTQFVWQPFSIEFQGFVKKKLNIYTRILNIMKL